VEFDPSQYLSAARAAARAGLSVPRIHQLRESGELPAVRTDAAFLFHVADVDRLRRVRERSRAMRKTRHA
jgi:hypothetical protein